MNLKEYVQSFLDNPLELEVPLQNKVITSHLEPPKSLTYAKIGQDVYNDVEFFKSFSDLHPTTVFDKVNTAELSGTEHVLKLLLQHPIIDVETLKARQTILKNLETKSLSFESIKENELLWLFDELDPKLKELYDMVFFRFKFLKPLNQHPTAITATNLYSIVISPIMGILTPLLYVLIPYMLISFKFKLKMSFKVYLQLMMSTFVTGGLFDNKRSTWRILSFVLTVFFYFQGIYNSAELSKTLYKISKFLVDKINAIIASLQHAVKLISEFWTSEITTHFVSSEEFKPTEEELAYVNSLKVLPFDLRSNFGQQLHIYYTIDRTIVKSILTKAYVLDALTSLTRFKTCYEASYTQFEISSVPRFELSETYHPCIDSQKVVKNDIKLGNIILTGPNAGGKSTFIKSILIDALLSQTCGIVLASNAKLTPFTIIDSQINIPDSKGYESLFEAEMYRCKAKLDQMKALKSNEHALFIMDEIFNSTNPVEGMAGAYAIANKLSDYSNCLIIFTTHYVYLTKLQKTGKFTNYRMNVTIKDAEITFPYKLSRGISKQYIALDLLKKNGFDLEIIEQAEAIKRVLTKPQKSLDNKNVQD